MFFIRYPFHSGIGGLIRHTLFWLFLTTSCLAALPLSLLLRVQRLVRRHHANRLTIQVHAWRILRHACPVATSSAPDSDALFELFLGYSEQIQVLLSILENPFL